MSRPPTRSRPLSALTLLAVTGLLSGCADAPVEDAADAPEPEPSMPASPSIRAANAFYYYEDVDAAWRFYVDVLGFETVVDYGFAKIMRVSPTSYVTLVDAAEGMHDADEPKSVTLAVVTEEVEAWYDYLVDQGVPMRADLTVREGSAHDGFVAIDPEGYFLEFERFNPHPENERLLPTLETVRPLYAAEGLETRRPRELGVQASVLWLYYRDIPGTQAFYEQAMGLEMIVDQGWAKVYPVSETGFIGFVDGERGLHEATDEKGVTVSFFVDDVDAWFRHMEGAGGGFELRTPEITDESERVRVFVGYDPEGYYLEWDTFLDVEGNERLLELLGG